MNSDAFPPASNFPIKICGDRIFLRTLHESDCGTHYVAWLNDPEVNRFLETRHEPQTLDSVRSFVAGLNARHDEFLFGIVVRDLNLHIGNIKLGPVPSRHPVADVGLFIGDRRYWARGFATEAIRLISRHAFEVMGLRKLSAGMYAENQSSYRAFRKAGYRDEGRRRAHYELNGVMSDLLLVGLIPNDLERQL